MRFWHGQLFLNSCCLIVTSSGLVVFGWTKCPTTHNKKVAWVEMVRKPVKSGLKPFQFLRKLDFEIERNRNRVNMLLLLTPQQLVRLHLLFTNPTHNTQHSGAPPPLSDTERKARTYSHWPAWRSPKRASWEAWCQWTKYVQISFLMS